MRADKQHYSNLVHNEFLKGKKSTRKEIIINGEHFESLKKASERLGINHVLITRMHKELSNSCRSEIEKEVSIKKTVTFKLPKAQ